MNQKHQEYLKIYQDYFNTEMECPFCDETGDPHREDCFMLDIIAYIEEGEPLPFNWILTVDEKHEMVARIATKDYDFVGVAAEMGEEIEKRQQLNKLHRQLAELNATLEETKRDIAFVEDKIWALENG